MAIPLFFPLFLSIHTQTPTQQQHACLQMRTASRSPRDRACKRTDCSWARKRPWDSWSYMFAASRPCASAACFLSASSEAPSAGTSTSVSTEDGTNSFCAVFEYRYFLNLCNFPKKNKREGFDSSSSNLPYSHNMRRRSESVHVLVDCGYDALMSEDERKGLCRQLDCCVRCVCFETELFCTCGYCGVCSSASGGGANTAENSANTGCANTPTPAVFAGSHVAIDAIGVLRRLARDGGDGDDAIRRN
jgi:hypothetical protein